MRPGFTFGVDTVSSSNRTEKSESAALLDHAAKPSYHAAVSTVEEIKTAIDRLSFEERCRLMALLSPIPDDDWDRKMRADAAAGKFAGLVGEAEEERKAGVLREFPTPGKP